jgi:FtsH-binding integral membrane protein
MRDNEDHTTDKLVRNERRGIWLALVMVLVLALTLLMGSDARRALLTALPIAIVVAMIWLAQSRTRIARKRDRDVVTHDELRQTALAHAYRWAFLVVLAALAGFCLSSTVLAFDLSAQMLAALTVTLGASAFLALFLLFDRA